MSKKKFWLGICVVLFLIALAGAWLYRSATLGPEFYRRSLTVDASQARTLGEQMEDDYLTAHNTAVRESTWSLQLSDEKLNGWISEVLPRKYPGFQPTRIDNLATSIAAGKIRIAFRIKDSPFPFVICVHFVPFITDDEKHIGFRLDQIGAGVFPLPKKQATEQITRALNRAKVPIAWSVENGRPVGLIPSSFSLPKGIKRRLQVKNVSLEEGQLTLSGIASDSD